MTGKSQSITELIVLLQARYGEANIVINDHWESDVDAIGLSDMTSQFLAYVSTISGENDSYYLALENPLVDDALPYSPAGEFDKLTFNELGPIVAAHLQIAKNE